ncbi:glycosyltransferase family 2 protein [Sphingobacterium suaedae]|uniref:Glycosyltransferase family 2 protein n=1 Tax=Sphingobacterium suaedae TaxID=1686402 RepID=A0ABW5KKK3_9SPHI
MLYSIIIPHKNAADLLDRLLDSIPSRSDLEVIVVDDGSHDQERVKLQELSGRYAFTLYTNPHANGAGASRNIGLEHARGTYLIFADSDDFFGPDFARELDRIPSYGTDLLFYNVHSVDSTTYRDGYRHLFFNQLINDYRQKGAEDIRYKYSVPWGKVYRRAFIEKNRIRFAEVIAGNDMWFSCLCGIFCSSFTVRDATIYTVTVREGSIVSTVNPTYFLSRFQETLRVNDLLRKHNLSKYQYSVLYFISNAHKFGVKGYVAKKILAHRSNLFIGIEKIFSYKKVMIDRENRRK